MAPRLRGDDVDPPDFGLDPSPGVATIDDGGELRDVPSRATRGRYVDYYAALRDAVRGSRPLPVDAVAGIRSIALLEAGLRSAAARAEVVPVDPCGD